MSQVQEKFIRHALGLQGARFELKHFYSMDQEKKIWMYEIVPDEEARLCSLCGQEAIKHEKEWIELKDLPLGAQAEVVIWRVQRYRVHCKNCAVVVVEKMPFRGRFGRLTKRLEEFIIQLLFTRMITLKDISRTLRLDYDTIYRIDRQVLEECLVNLSRPYPKHIAVDEKSFQKGHSYVTVVTDAETAQVIFVSLGRSKDSLDQFFKWLGKKRCQAIETIAMDLHEPYHASAREYAPQAQRVPDKFHVIQRLNEAMEQGYRELAQNTDAALTRKRGTELRWLIRRKQMNQSDSQLDLLQWLKERNQPLYETYLLKDLFHQFFDHSTAELEAAKQFLIRWTVDAFKTGLKSFQKFADYVSRNVELLLNVIRTQKTSSVSEGINTKITVIKNMAYGFRDPFYFQLKIWQKCGILGKALTHGKTS